MTLGGSAHRKLIENTVLLFLRLGYMIELEKKILGRYFVDVYAEKDGEILIVECGYTEKNRLAELKQHFNVIHFPYISSWLRRSYGYHMTVEDLARKMGIKEVPR